VAAEIPSRDHLPISGSSTGPDQERIPLEKYRARAEALGMNSRDFILALLPF
jgi:hypothetical protein